MEHENCIRMRREQSLRLQEQIKSLKEELRKRFGITKIGLFGSYARNEQKESSDIDILVEFERPIGLELLEAKFFLEDQLNIKVDIGVTLKQSVREEILKEIIYL